MCYGCCLSAAIFIKGATMKEIFKIFVLLVMICTFTAVQQAVKPVIQKISA